MEIKPLNLFYEEPDPDRWFKYDRYPRRLIRRFIRGKQRPGGVMMIALNLMEGLDKIGIPYRFNDYKYIKRHPEEIACIIGKPHLLTKKNWVNPIILGAGIFSHPIDYPDLLKQYPTIERILVPGPWMQQMFQPWYGDIVTAWPVGINTEHWSMPIPGYHHEIDFVIYDKLNQDRDTLLHKVLNPILKILKDRNLVVQIIRYGAYTHAELQKTLSKVKAAIFLSESETQGIAYQQILSSDIPILAWDRSGYWQDPHYYPERVKYKPVSSVPYWDERCGVKFTDAEDFKEKLDGFLASLNEFKPRKYILENLTLEICAEKYLQIYREVEDRLLRK
ncbi:MAG: hypothetical protein JWP44_3644 [Mucilaginibacter sp.]|nr:hypothetical protein [Mucilaginibacter sp.]